MYGRRRSSRDKNSASFCIKRLNFIRIDNFNQSFSAASVSDAEARHFCVSGLFKRVVARRAVYHTLNVITISLYVRLYV